MNLQNIKIDDRLTLDATTSEDNVLTAMLDDARPLVCNGPHRSYLLPPVTLNGRTFTPSAYFSDGLLTSVHLTWVDPEAIKQGPWEGFSFERERLVAEADARWLAASLKGSNTTTATYWFDWGTIWAGFDERSGFSSIVIRYIRS